MQEFTVSAGANLDQLVMLENPFLALRLHVQVNSFVTTTTGDICMGMAFYGCHHSEGEWHILFSSHKTVSASLSSYPGSTDQWLSLCDTTSC